ncbi:Serine/threonine-protein kinase AFC3 [Zancudomyces culisetae]|uniref:Serine/threonine-protein kinase AFC3 n=1 Tax=Zancudomyces culisetae TaxID=1213189 RepID=A0A1R1PDB6_ZANCU|nr:Serine/threonine-protein kinase AFC3 [Zancudomyces culisetae]|eukprot:OMH78909.1 Serine/threonine-protein kinase AFC3 [Zancudomyces culisetae]
MTRSYTEKYQTYLLEDYRSKNVTNIINSTDHIDRINNINGIKNIKDIRVTNNISKTNTISSTIAAASNNANPRKRAIEHQHIEQCAGDSKTKRRRKAKNIIKDDDNGHILVERGVEIGKRYKVLKLLGQGTFGKVVECIDMLDEQKKENGVTANSKKTLDKKTVAIKVVRAIPKYKEAAKMEIKILRLIERYKFKLIDNNVCNDSQSSEYTCKNSKDYSYRHKHSIVKLKGEFEQQNHICMVFEKYGPSIYEYMKKRKFKPYGIRQIQHISKQIFESIRYLHEELKIIHTDIKPENILIEYINECSAKCESGNLKSKPNTSECIKTGTSVNTECHGGADDANDDNDEELEVDVDIGTNTQSHSGCIKENEQELKKIKIKMVDFGSAVVLLPKHDLSNISGSSSGKTCDSNGCVYNYNNKVIVSTRHYRAPEVIMEKGWSFPCDMWSIGCMLVEMYTGKTVFQTHEDYEHLSMIQYILGPIPDSMFEMSKFDKEKIVNEANRYNSLYQNEKNKKQRQQKGKRHFSGLKPLSSVIFDDDSDGDGEKCSGDKNDSCSHGSGHGHGNVSMTDRLDIMATKLMFYDLVRSLLEVDPTKRMTAAEALEHPFHNI